MQHSAARSALVAEHCRDSINFFHQTVGEASSNRARIMHQHTSETCSQLCSIGINLYCHMLNHGGRNSIRSTKNVNNTPNSTKCLHYRLYPHSFIISACGNTTQNSYKVLGHASTAVTATRTPEVWLDQVTEGVMRLGRPSWWLWEALTPQGWATGPHWCLPR